MFNKRTVFVIGAGCSAEFGLPVGAGLQDDIYKAITHDIQLLNESKVGPIVRVMMDGAIGPGFEKVMARFQSAIHTKPSIDQLLNLHQDDEHFVRMGKAGIVNGILAAEARSTLRLTSDRNLATMAPPQVKQAEPLKDCWLTKLFYLMNAGVFKNNKADMFRNVSFVCFNYDRCIEHYFYHSLIALMQCGPDEAKEAMAALKIWHPYGTLGKLPHEVGNDPSLDFGDYANWNNNLGQFVKNIKIFTESVDSKQVRDIGDAVFNAEQIIFLGFGYIHQNIELLGSTGQGCRAKKAYLGMFGASESNAEIFQLDVRGQLFAQTGRIEEILNYHKASTFMDQFGRTIAA